MNAMQSRRIGKVCGVIGVLVFGAFAFLRCFPLERFRPIAEELADVRTIIEKNGGPEELNRQVTEYFKQVRENRSDKELLRNARDNAERIPALRGLGLTCYYPPSIKTPGALWVPESIKIRRGGHRNTVFVFVFDPFEDFTPNPNRYVEVCKNVYMQRYFTQ
ncbi:MAG: hypothetical protein NT105_02635 [Verrucomicrobia bacterium]|nr:hypothetical protein [Verrucomicrobiota bacterium]